MNLGCYQCQLNEQIPRLENGSKSRIVLNLMGTKEIVAPKLDTNTVNSPGFITCQVVSKVQHAIIHKWFTVVDMYS